MLLNICGTLQRMFFVVPGPPIHLQVVAASSRQLKLSWQPPEEPRGVLRGYHVYLGTGILIVSH